MANAKVLQRIKDRTDEIKIGGTYFLSSFYDKDGAMVKVLSKSHKINGAGWPSTVEVKVLEEVTSWPEQPYHYYRPGRIITCNASNLYERRQDANHAHKYPS